MGLYRLVRGGAAELRPDGADTAPAAEHVGSNAHFTGESKLCDVEDGRALPAEGGLRCRTPE
jgi:hypothetical protein